MIIKIRKQLMGFVLIWVLMIMAIMLGMIAMLIKPITNLSHSIFRQQEMVAADFAAEAGVDWGLKNYPKISEYSQHNPIDYLVKTQYLESDSCKRQRYLITSIGNPDKHFSRSLRALIINGPDQPNPKCPKIQSWNYVPPDFVG